MLRISSETGGKLACRRDWLLHSHGCEARSAEQPADIIRGIVEAARGLDNVEISRAGYASAGVRGYVLILISLHQIFGCLGL
jgi:hypothetical protein